MIHHPSDDAALIAHAMFSRWCQENLFRYLRAHYGLDALDSYATVADDSTAPSPTPPRRSPAPEPATPTAASPTSKPASPNGSQPN